MASVTSETAIAVVRSSSAMLPAGTNSSTSREILELDEPIGRKLDFLTQELNRESNTIGSKCQDVAITRLVVELKSEIEKIREQIQNIE